ncbi:MAG: cation:proton antiporter [Chloroflexi bacterium]|nr:cation:proton antiporter [Chloroflexota bacterium]
MESPVELAAELILRLAVILIAAKLGGEFAQRVLRIPALLGELGAGIAIGPFALGGIAIGSFGPFFEIPEIIEVVDGAIRHTEAILPVAPEFFFLAQLAAVLLLFEAGLETNRAQFIKYARPATAVAMGGVILPFGLGVVATLMFGFADTDSIIGFLPALFVGTAMTATSVGITARVLADMNKLHVPEGVTVLGAAVVDDVLGLLILTVVIGINETGEVSAGSIVFVALKAIGFWLGLTIVGTLLSNYISRGVTWFKTTGAVLGLALGIAFLAAGVAELFGLAMIIGSYSIGLALSSTELRHRIEEPMRTVNQFVVPVFFVVIGMQVDIPAIIEGALLFGVVLSVLAIVSKLLGAGVPALFVGFNRVGSTRIALGMLPRGEVALIVAGIGLGAGVIGSEIFGVVIMMTLITTVLAPLLLVPAFAKGGSGLRKGEPDATLAPERPDEPVAGSGSPGDAG